jgi:succinyl-diaminopimelate desuccinylase
MSGRPASLDPVELARALIRCPSVTPADAGALDVLSERLQSLGFTCHRLRFEQAGTPAIDNLYARIGKGGRNFCFAGHTDVVPVGRRDSWSVDPFGAELVDGRLYGRGAADMKGAIACFVAAAADYLNSKGSESHSLSLLITGDEEGPAVNGTVKVLGWLAERGEKLDACLVGEPTSQARLGDMMKIGRRGSFNGRLTVRGTEGHVAYPHLADNPVPKLLRLLAALGSGPLDAGTSHFQPSNLEPTSIDVGNQATNVIPPEAGAAFNVRFNDRFTGASLEAFLRQKLDAAGLPYELAVQVTGEAFLTEPGALSEAVAASCHATVGLEPELSTSGGTSDARFIHRACPVVEFGLVNRTMHKTDEHVPLADLAALTKIYRAILGLYLGQT